MTVLFYRFEISTKGQIETQPHFLVMSALHLITDMLPFILHPYLDKIAGRYFDLVCPANNQMPS